MYLYTTSWRKCLRMTGWNCAQNEIAVITDIKGKSVQRTENKCLPWYKNIIRMREHKLSK